MLKLSSMSNRKSDSNCMVMIRMAVAVGNERVKEWNYSRLVNSRIGLSNANRKLKVVLSAVCKIKQDRNDLE